MGIIRPFSGFWRDGASLVPPYGSPSCCCQKPIIGYAGVNNQKGETNKALDDFNKAIQNDPENKEAYQARGELYRLRGEKEKAEADLAKFMELMQKR